MSPEQLIGVIDLRHGVPVHAIAGERNRYVRHHDSGQPLRPVDLIGRYRRHGVRRFYVADLDGIVDHNPRWDLLNELTADLIQNERLLIDAGWGGNETESELHPIRQMVTEHPNRVSFVAAAESAATGESPSRLASVIGASRVWLGFDYRGGNWLGRNGTEASWIKAAGKKNFAGIVVLDLATVGLAEGPSTEPIVRRVKAALPDVAILTGGGVRDDVDVARLNAAGASGCLVATMLIKA